MTVCVKPWRTGTIVNAAIVTDSLKLGPQQWSLCRCHSSQSNETEFGWEAKKSFTLWSENGMVWARAIESAQQADRPWAGLLYRDCREGRGGVLTGRTGVRRRVAHPPDGSAECSVSAHRPPPPSRTAVSWAVLLHMVPKLRCQAQPLGAKNPGLKCRVQGLCTWTHMMKWN